MAQLRLGASFVHYQDRGNGPALLLVHGGATTHHYWDGVISHLPDGYRTIAPDLFGCGATSPWSGRNALCHDDEAVLVRKVIDAVGERVHLVGHSYGAAVCLRVAIASPTAIQSLTLIEPPIYRLLEQAGFSDLFEEISDFRAQFEQLATDDRGAVAMELLVDRFGGSGTWNAMSSRAHKSMLGVIDALIVGFRANAENATLLADCARINISTLLPWGELTGAPEKVMSEVLNGNLPDSRTVSVPTARHQSPLTHPAVVAQLIANHTAGS